MGKSADGYQQNIYGNLIIESNKSDSVSDLGAGEAFSIKGTNKEGKRFTLAHHEGGITRCESEQTLQVDCGSKKGTQGTALQVTAHTGKISITSIEDHVVIKASKSITLDANDIYLKGTNLIQIGGPDNGDTREIKLTAQKIEVQGKKGNLPDHLKQSSFIKAVSGPNSMVGDLAMDVAKSYGVSAATAAGTAVGGPVGGAIAGQAAQSALG